MVTLALAGWGFRGRWSEIGAAVAATGPLRLAAALGCTAAGLLLTARLWRLLLRAVGPDVPARDAASVFLVGQLGKYVPGSVWSIAVQARLGRRHDLPARSVVAASTVFLLVHTASGLLVGGALVVGGALAGSAVAGGPWPWAAALVGALTLAPPLVRRLAGRIAGAGVGATWGRTDAARAAALMALVWLAYGASLLLLVPGPGSPGIAGAVAAFALAHAAGVLVVVAPAGVGAREAVLVALLAPAVGLADAAAAALLARVVHAVADFAVAGGAALVAGTTTGSAAARRRGRTGGDRAAAPERAGADAR
nr:lysylphosphatidylglycerol synthase domain-containing protein [Nocardioides sp. zg-1308]